MSQGPGREILRRTKPKQKFQGVHAPRHGHVRISRDPASNAAACYNPANRPVRLEHVAGVLDLAGGSRERDARHLVTN
jgi:hypothetical protein